MFSWPEVDEAQLHRDRMARTRTVMDRLGVDHLLLTSFDNIRFATGYRTMIIAEGFDWFAAVVDRDGECDIFVPWVDEVVEQPDPEAPHIRRAHPLPSWTPAIPHESFWTGALHGVLSARGARRVGHEQLAAELLAPLAAALPEVELIPVTTRLHEARLLKTPAELELLAAASTVASRAADEAIRAGRPGMTDHDVLAVAMASMQAAGAEYICHSVCNVRRGTGTWFAVGNELRDGEAFFFDIGCYGRGGYASDMARVGFVGEPPEPVRAAYRALLEAHHAGEDAARPGASPSRIHEVINETLRRQGVPITPYASGHGVGLRGCELPTIHRADRIGWEQPLAEGMAISLEPETAAEVGGRTVILKVEDNYVVEAGGLRRLTDATYTLDDA